MCKNVCRNYYELRDGEILGVEDEVETIKRCTYFYFYTFKFHKIGNEEGSVDLVQVSTYCSEDPSNYFDLKEILDFETSYICRTGYELLGWKRTDW